MPVNDAAALLAAAINDHSIIGNPRTGTTAVTLLAADVNEANRIAAALAQLACEPQTNIRYDHGEPSEYLVVLYRVDDQRRLSDAIRRDLEPQRREQLETLIRARGPIPDHILEGIWQYSRRGLTRQQIANRLNDAEIIDGMRCIRWTSAKVSDALKLSLGRHEQAPEEAA
jgi:hypothetical protein